MVITSLIDDTSRHSLPTEHGLSLHFQLQDGTQLLFDMGQSGCFIRNAEQLGIDIREVDMAVISHGHYDHGGGLQAFLETNHKAKVYIHPEALMPHYSLREGQMVNIGLAIPPHTTRLVMCKGVTRISDTMTLFADVQGECCYPSGNRWLYGANGQQDRFEHEQSLIIQEGEMAVLVAGCAHRGIVNIIRRCTELLGHAPTHVLAGMHLMKSGMTPSEETAFIRQLAAELQRYSSTQFYTMHCTTEAAFNQLHELLGAQMAYLSGGERVKG